MLKGFEFEKKLKQEGWRSGAGFKTQDKGQGAAEL